MYLVETFLGDSVEKLGINLLAKFLGKNEWRIRAKAIFNIFLL